MIKEEAIKGIKEAKGKVEEVKEVEEAMQEQMKKQGSSGGFEFDWINFVFLLLSAAGAYFFAVQFVISPAQRY